MNSLALDTQSSPNMLRDFSPFPRPFWAEIPGVRFFIDDHQAIVVCIPGNFYSKYFRLYGDRHAREFSGFFSETNTEREVVIRQYYTTEHLTKIIGQRIDAALSTYEDPVIDSIEDHTAINTIQNITSVRDAVLRTERIFQEILTYIASNINQTGGLFEQDVIDEIKRIFSNAGGTPAADIIFATEEHTFHAHYRIPLGERGRPIRRGDIALLDLGILFPRALGGCSDFTRTFTIGSRDGLCSPRHMTEDQKIIQNIVDAMYEASVGVLRPGQTLLTITDVSMNELYQRMNELYGWDKSKVDSVASLIYPYYVGHHITAFSQHPDIELDVVLRPGMLVTIEPGLHFHRRFMPFAIGKKGLGKGFGYRNEDIYLITADGAIRLSTATEHEISAAVEAGKSWISPSDSIKS